MVKDLIITKGKKADGKRNCQNWAQVTQTLLIGREIWVGPRALEKTLLDRDRNWFRKAPAPQRNGK